MSLTSDYKTYAGIGDTTFDAQLAIIVPAVQAMVERYTGRTFNTATFTVYLDGLDAPELFLSNTPITSITSVAEVGIDNIVLNTWDSTDYKFDANTGIISLDQGEMQVVVESQGLPTPRMYTHGAVFPMGFRNIKVVYVGGYAALPADLQLLIFQMIDYVLANAGKDTSMQSENLGHYSYSRMQGLMGALGSQFAIQLNGFRSLSI